MTNVRRHAHTELDFTGDAQIILLAGKNGSGKSTVLEAINLALWGETRHGRRGIAGMVRRGAQHEGMQVDLSMEINEITYDITRRWEKGKSTATISINGAETMRSPDGVTAEITRVLGMDSAGFRLACVAKQKELDGLADLTPARRKAAVSRLLRLDAISQAAMRAREDFNKHKEIAQALSHTSDVAGAEETLKTATLTMSEADAAVQDAKLAHEATTTELRESESVETKWREKNEQVTHAQGKAEALFGEVERLERELSELVVPDALPVPEHTLEEIHAELTQVAANIARGEANSQLQDQRDATSSSILRIEARLEVIKTDLGTDTIQSTSRAISETSEKLEKLETKRNTLQEQREQLLETVAQVGERIRTLKARLETDAELGDVCEMCEQPINEEHKQTQAKKHLEELGDLESQDQSVRLQGQGVRDSLNALSAQKLEVEADLSQATARQGHVAALFREQEGLLRDLEGHKATLERLVIEPINLDQVYARKGRLEASKAQSEAWASNETTRQSMLVRLASLDQQVAHAKERLQDAKNLVELSKPDAALVEAWEVRKVQLERRQAEGEFLAALREQQAGTRAELEGAKKALETAKEAQVKSQERQRQAVVSSKAAQVLTSLAQRMATEVRPALEGEIAVLLDVLSEGRFNQVKVSEDYDITVMDLDGTYQPIGEYSGGEADLIALAVRLALAQVVSRRHGGSGGGFLILDEVFGSQDQGRRDSILDGLRKLRGIYGQILLISHVGGIDEAADRVISLEVDEDDPTLTQVG
jgi:exonuclease SbcC